MNNIGYNPCIGLSILLTYFMLFKRWRFLIFPKYDLKVCDWLVVGDPLLDVYEFGFRLLRVLNCVFFVYVCMYVSFRLLHHVYQLELPLANMMW